MEPSGYKRILVRATNWVGDAVMSLPALKTVRELHPKAHIAVLALPWVADLYRHEPFADEVIPLAEGRGRDIGGKLRLARALRERRFDCALLLPNSFDSALLVWLARIPVRIGYRRDARGLLLTHPVQPPIDGEIPRHQRFYYLELLKRAGWIERLPDVDAIRLQGASRARQTGRARFDEMGWRTPVVGVSPGAAFGAAKRWLPERFAESAAATAGNLGAAVALFGSKDERALGDQIAEMIRARAGAAVPVRNFAGATSLAEYIELAAACALYLTNDSGGMHIASALGVPTVAVFGATDEVATGPTGPLARIVKEPVDCSPCLLRECPIDHRCMTRVDAQRVIRIASSLVALVESRDPE